VPQQALALERWREDLFTHVGPSVVTVRGDNQPGSGFFVDSRGLILTARSVVGSARTVTVTDRNNRRHTANVIARADGADLALLHAPTTSHAATLHTAHSVDVGAWSGVVAAAPQRQWSFTLSQFTALYQPDAVGFQHALGSDARGAPVFDAEGNVVGIAVTGPSRTSNVDRALNIDLAIRSFERLRRGCQCVEVTAPAGASIRVDGFAVGAGSLVVPLDAGAHRVSAVIGGRERTQTVVVPRDREASFR
jgi:S1-C subfamily serine protease